MRPCLRFRAPAACYGCRDPLARLFNDIELLRRLSRDPSPHRTWRKHRETGDQGFLRRRYLDRDGSVEVQDGHTVVYRMILAKVTMLELTREPDTETGATMDPVHSVPQTILKLSLNHHRASARMQMAWQSSLILRPQSCPSPKANQNLPI